MERNDRRNGQQTAGGGTGHDGQGNDLVDFLLRPPMPPEVDTLRSILSQVVRTEIVPQLIVAEKSALGALWPNSDRLPANDETSALGESRAAPAMRPSAFEREQFEVIVLYRDTFDCFAFVGALRDRGISLTDIYLGLFQPVAQHLGQRWSEDSLSFLEVTKAIGQIQTMVHALGSGEVKPHPVDQAHRIVLASRPEEQHALGMLVLSQLFEMQGWEVEGGSHLKTGRQLDDLVHNQWFGVVGLSASSEEGARQLKASIDSLRESSMNNSIAVIVGGNGFIEHPEISDEIGADGVAVDGLEAVGKAEQLLNRGKKPDRS